MELKSNFGNAKGTLDSERSLIEKMQTELKNVFFRVVQLMLKEEEQSIPLNGLVILVQYMQITYIIFNRQIWKVWQNESVTIQLNKIFGYFLFTPYFEMLNFDSMVAMMYVCLGMMIFSLMLVFLLSYSLNKAKQSFTWPVFLLRFLITLFISLLYMPIIDILLSMIACDTDENGKLMHQLFPVECWSNIHIVHGIVSIIGLFIFFVITILFSLLYYESRYVPNDVSSKLSGRPLSIFLTYELIMVICYTFMTGRSFDYLMILIMMVGSFTIFWKIHVEQPYSHPIIAKMWSMLVALNMWGVTLLCFSKFLEGILFFGTVYAFLAGLPLMMLAVMRSEKQHYDLLLLNLNKVQDADQVLALTNHLIKLLHRTVNDQNSSLLIDGFLEIHRATCTREDCYLKQKKLPNQRLQKPAFKEGAMAERDVDLIMVIGQIYFNQIKKFPNEISLRIRYSFFLLDHMKQRQQAFNELSQAEQLSPSLDNEFTIFRYKKIIDDEMNQLQNENLGNLDVATELAFQNNMRSFQNKIERATLMHMDFWSQLQEDSPDLGKLNDIGTKINLSIQQVEELWNKMQKMTQNLPKAMRLYGKFIIEVLQDKEFGEDLLERSRHLQQQNNKMKNKATITLVSGEDIGFEPQPTLLVSTSSEKFAQITNLNLACCNLFGYNKSEMINRKINIFMPNLYSKFHDGIIENFLQTNESKNMNKERMVYIKMKSNYIAPCYILLKVIQSMDDSIQLAAQFRLPKSFKPSCYLILDSEEIVDSISATCIPLLNLDSKQISHKKTSINELFPNFQQNKHIYLTKTGGPLSYSQATASGVSNSNIASQELIDQERREEAIQFNCFLIEVMNEHQDQVVGYVMKLELTGEQIQNLSADLQIPMPKMQSNNMQFKFNPNKFLYIGEYVNDTNSQRVDQTVIWDQGDQSSMISSYQQPDLALKSQVKTEKSDDSNPIPTLPQKINYAEGIKTLRLYENRVQDIDDRDEMMSEEEEALQGKSVFQRNQDMDNDQDVQQSDFNNVFKSRKNLQGVVNSYQTPTVITKLNWTANILVIVLVTLSFVDYFVAQNQFDDIFSTIKLVQSTNLRNSELSTILASVQNLQMQNKGIWNLTTAEATIYEAQQRTILNTSIQNVDTLNKQLMLSGITISDQLSELQTQDVVQMRFGVNQYQKFDIMEATQQIVSKALNIRDKPLVDIDYDDEDVYFVEFNLLNDLVYQLRNSSNLYASGLSYKTTEKQQTFLVILGISAGALGLGLILLVVAMLQVNLNQEEILAMFLDIPDKTVKYLYNKSENFISNLQIGEEEEVLSEMEELDKEEQEELNKTLKSKRKKKKFKNTNKDQRNYIFAFILIILLLESYFIFNFFMSDQLLQNLKQMVPEINATARAESFYRYADNGERSLYMKREMPLLNLDSYAIAKENINQLYALDSAIHQEHSLNVDITNSIYADSFKQIFMLQPCTILSVDMNEVTQDSCESFADGAIYQGMAVGLARYFENIRYMMTIYDQFYGFPKANFTTIARGFAVLRNITKDSNLEYNNILNLNGFNQSKETRQMQDNYLRGTFRYLMNRMILGISLDIQDTETQRLALFIVFEVLLFIIYFILWLPLVLKMTRDIWRTRAMIMMIPLRVIQRIRSIKMFIRDFIHAKDVQI